MKKFLIFLIFLSSFDLFSRNPNCDLNIEAIDEAFFTKMVNLSKKANWNDKNKTAFVDYGKGKNINIIVYACVHLGITATYSFPRVNKTELVNQVLWFAHEIFGDEKDFNIISEHIKSANFKFKLDKISTNKTTTYVDNEYYSNIELSFQKLNNKYSVEIGWYH